MQAKICDVEVTLAIGLALERFYLLPKDYSIHCRYVVSLILAEWRIVDLQGSRR